MPFLACQRKRSAPAAAPSLTPLSWHGQRPGELAATEPALVDVQVTEAGMAREPFHLGDLVEGIHARREPPGGDLVRPRSEANDQAASPAKHPVDLLEVCSGVSPEVDDVRREDSVEGPSGNGSRPLSARRRRRRPRRTAAALYRQAMSSIVAEPSTPTTWPSGTSRASCRSVRPWPQPTSRTRASFGKGARRRTAM